MRGLIASEGEGILLDPVLGNHFDVDSISGVYISLRCRDKHVLNQAYGFIYSQGREGNPRLVIPSNLK